MKPKVLMVSHHFPPRYQGGVELITFRAARWLIHAGYEVEVVCVEAIDQDTGLTVEAREEIFEEVAVQRLFLRRVSQTDAFQSGYRNTAIGQWFARHLRLWQPDLVHVQSCYLITASVIEAAKDEGVPTVVSLHDYWFICPRLTLLHPDDARCSGPAPEKCAWCLMTERRRYRLPDQVTGGMLGGFARQLMKYPAVVRNWGWHRPVSSIRERQSYLSEQLASVDMVTTPASLVRELMVAQGLDPGRIRLVPHGVEVAQMPAPSPRQADEAFRIGYLGNIFPAKGVHVLIAAFSRLRARDRRLELVIYGDPDKFPAYTRRLRPLAADDPRIVFAGPYRHEQVGAILRDIDVLVVPSLWYEIGPLVTLEAFTSRTPVVASNIPNMKYQIRHGVDGLLFTVNDAADLAHQLQKLVDDPQLLAQLQNGIGRVRTLDEEMHEWTEIYKTVLAEYR